MLKRFQLNCNIIDSIKSTESKVRTALYIMTNTSTGMYCSVDFILMVIYKLKVSCTDSKVRATQYSTEMASQERTAQWLSFERSHFRISSTLFKVRTTLYSIIHSTTGKNCSVAFSWMHGHVTGFHSQTKVSTMLHAFAALIIIIVLLESNKSFCDKTYWISCIVNRKLKQ